MELSREEQAKTGAISKRSYDRSRETEEQAIAGAISKRSYDSIKDRSPHEEIKTQAYCEELKRIMEPTRFGEETFLDGLQNRENFTIRSSTRSDTRFDRPQSQSRYELRASTRSSRSSRSKEKRTKKPVSPYAVSQLPYCDSSTRTAYSDSEHQPFLTSSRRSSIAGCSPEGSFRITRSRKDSGFRTVPELNQNSKYAKIPQSPEGNMDLPQFQPQSTAFSFKVSPPGYAPRDEPSPKRRQTFSQGLNSYTISGTEFYHYGRASDSRISKKRRPSPDFNNSERHCESESPGVPERYNRRVPISRSMFEGISSSTQTDPFRDQSGRVNVNPIYKKPIDDLSHQYLLNTFSAKHEEEAVNQLRHRSRSCSPDTTRIDMSFEESENVQDVHQENVTPENNEAVPGEVRGPINQDPSINQDIIYEFQRSAPSTPSNDCNQIQAIRYFIRNSRKSFIQKGRGAAKFLSLTLCIILIVFDHLLASHKQGYKDIDHVNNFYILNSFACAFNGFLLILYSCNVIMKKLANLIERSRIEPFGLFILSFSYLYATVRYLMFSMINEFWENSGEKRTSIDIGVASNLNETEYETIGFSINKRTGEKIVMGLYIGISFLIFALNFYDFMECILMPNYREEQLSNTIANSLPNLGLFDYTDNSLRAQYSAGGSTLSSRVTIGHSNDLPMNNHIGDIRGYYDKVGRIAMDEASLSKQLRKNSFLIRLPRVVHEEYLYGDKHLEKTLPNGHVYIVQVNLLRVNAKKLRNHHQQSYNYVKRLITLFGQLQPTPVVTDTVKMIMPALQTFYILNYNCAMHMANMDNNSTKVRDFSSSVNACAYLIPLIKILYEETKNSVRLINLLKEIEFQILSSTKF